MFALALPLSASMLFFADVAFADEVTLITSIEVEDKASCEVIGGSWDSASCTLSSSDEVTVTLGVTLTVAEGVTLCNKGGTVRNNGTIHNDGDLLNIAEEFFFFGIIINDGASDSASISPALFLRAFVHGYFPSL